MKIIAYARIPDEKERQQFRDNVGSRWSGRVDHSFEFDGLAGQAGLAKTLRRAAQPGVDMIVVNRFSDLGRDIAAAIRNAHHLVFDCAVDVYLFAQGYTLETFGDSGSSKIVAALNDALAYYGMMNRKIGIETARSSGAQIGRPLGVTFEDVRKVVDSLLNAKAPDSASVREVAKAVAENVPAANGKCSLGKASAFLKEAKRQREEIAFADETAVALIR